MPRLPSQVSDGQSTPPLNWQAPAGKHKINSASRKVIFFMNFTWMKTFSVNFSMSVFSQMMSDNRRCFICSNIAPVSGLEIQVFWKIAHNGWTPYFWTSSVTIEETITVHQGFELKRNWVHPCLSHAKGKWYLTTDDASKGRSNHATWEEKKQPNLEFTMWQIGRSFFGRVLTWKFSWLANGYWGIEVYMELGSHWASRNQTTL